MQTVHLRVNDADSGQPTPCRIRFSDAEGKYYAPLGHLTEFATGPNQGVGGNVLFGEKPHAYIDGTCEINLPPGSLHLQISKGFEYLPLDLSFELAPGKMALRFQLERWINLREQNWFSGDGRAHFLSPHAALLEARAEDLAVVNLLAVQCQVEEPSGKKYPAIPNLEAFSGQKPALETSGHLVAVNTLNFHPELGSLGLLNSHRVVYPLTFGGPEGKEDWALADWCDQCHRKNGLVVWTKTDHESPLTSHSPSGGEGRVRGQDFVYGEPLADLILGKVDAFEVVDSPLTLPSPLEGKGKETPFDTLPTWYLLQNAGLRVPLVGASGKESNGKALGVMRTYAHLQPEEPFTYQNWIEAVRAGRTFISNGPLIFLSVNDQESGTVLKLDEGKVRVKAEARSIVPFKDLEIVWNGQVLGKASAAGNPSSAQIDMEYTPEESCWLAARCRGDQHIFDLPTVHRLFAHTSPIYLEMAGKPFRPQPDVVRQLDHQLQSMLDWAQIKARCDQEGQRQRLQNIFSKASKLLLSSLNKS